MDSQLRLRTAAAFVGLLVAGITYGLFALHNLAVCGNVTCGAMGLLKIRFYLISIALPFAVGHMVGLFGLAAMRGRKIRKK